MGAWAPIEVLSLLLFIQCLYFVYLFLYQKNPPFLYKLVWLLILVPAVLVPLSGNYLISYDIQECVAIENTSYLNYISYAKLFLIFWLIFELIKDSFTKKYFDKKNLLLGLGVFSFIFSFYILGYISEQTGNYQIELYGLYGMILFIGILSYLVVKYSLFHVKLIATQALVAILGILVGAQFLFIQDSRNFLLNSGTFVLVITFGYFLVKSVQSEIESRELIQDQKNQLEKANDRLKVLDKQKTEFVSLASHQLRAPMTAIKGYIALILDGDYGELPQQMREPVNRIYSSTQSLIQIVGDFLDVTRIELGTMKFTLSDFDFKDLVKDVINELTPNIENSKLEFKFEFPEEAMPLRGDAAKIKQVMNNLIDNAVKYTKQGWVHAKVERLGTKYRFSVQDTGVGISPEALPKLFAKFVRAENANEANVIGTGLGLYVAKQMIEKHNGRIWAESEGIGKGSTFFVEIESGSR
jgi:signal transduction histidine kinase